MNFDKYLIPETPATEGFLGSLGSILSGEIQRVNIQQINQEIYALESYADAILQNLHTSIAMESNGDCDRLTSIAAKARMAGKKIKEGKNSNNPNLVAQGSNELSASMQELSSESRNAKDPKTKSKVWMVAKVIGAIVASVLLVFGAVTAGKALSTGVKSNDVSSLKNGSNQAKQKLSSDPVLKQMNQMTKDLEEARKQQAVNSANLKKLASDMEETAKMAADLQKSVEKARASEVSEEKILSNKGQVDKYFSGSATTSSDSVIIKQSDGTTKKVSRQEFDQMRKAADAENKRKEEALSRRQTQAIISAAGKNLDKQGQQMQSRLRANIGKFDVKMPDGSIKKMTLDEAMKSNGTLQI